MRSIFIILRGIEMNLRCLGVRGGESTDGDNFFRNLKCNCDSYHVQIIIYSFKKVSTPNKKKTVLYILKTKNHSMSFDSIKNTKIYITYTK